MSDRFLPATAEIKQVFVEAITSAGGSLLDSYDDGDRLFLRSVLPHVREVRPHDKMQAGVALRAADAEILVHPYTFREVCRNGAIIAHAIQTRRVERVEPFASEETIADVTAELRDAVRCGCDEEAFRSAVEQARTATELQADLVLQLLPMLSRMPQRMVAELLSQITVRFETGRDRSLFGVMNAVTSVARDTRDPELRWRLEELGGGIPARLTPHPAPDDTAAVLTA